MFITHFDKSYINWGEILVKTHAACYKGERFYISAVNLEEQNILHLKKLHPCVIVENEIVEPDSVPLVYTRRRWGGSYGHHFAEFMACRKAKVLQRVFEKFPEEEIFIMTDADIFINKMYNFNNCVQNHDAALLIGGDENPGQGFHTQIMSGMMVIKNNKKTKTLIDLWVSNMSEHKHIKGWKQWHWFWDQITLDMAVKELISKGLRVKSLKHEEFVNSINNPKAYMWSAHTGGVVGKERTFRNWTQQLARLKERDNGKI